MTNTKGARKNRLNVCSSRNFDGRLQRRRSTRHGSRSHRRHGDDRRRRRRRHLSRGSYAEYSGREGRAHQKRLNSDQKSGQRNHRDHSGRSDAKKRQHNGGGKRGSGGDRKAATFDHSLKVCLGEWASDHTLAKVFLQLRERVMFSPPPYVPKTVNRASLPLHCLAAYRS